MTIGPNTQLILGGVPFNDLEIPEQITLGGEQIVTVHQLPAGVRVLDMLGANDDPIAWEGLFLGPSASTNARTLDALRRAGQVTTLVWWDLQFSVVIRKFKILWQKYFQVGYEIECIVLQDQSQPASSTPQNNVDDLTSADMTNVLSDSLGLGMIVPSGLPGPVSSAAGIVVTSTAITAPPVGDGLDLSGLASGVTALRSAVGAVTDFASATASEIAPVTAAVSQTLTAASALKSQAESFIGGLSGVAGIVAGSASPAGLLQAVTIATQEVDINSLAYYTDRLGSNVNLGSGVNG